MPQQCGMVFVSVLKDKFSAAAQMY